MNPDIIKTKFFIKTVDPALRKLVSLLHDKKIKTTPSCSGHDITPDELQKIYTQLEKDTEEIRTKGLRLKEIESGKICTMQDSNYQLPWTLKQFISEVQTYQKKGVIGLHLGIAFPFVIRLLQR